MKLTAVQVDKAKYVKNKDRLSDGNNLYLRLSAHGGKSFERKQVSKEGKTTWITLGRYKEISLKEARDINVEVKKLLSEGYGLQLVREALERTNKASELGRIIYGYSNDTDELDGVMTFAEMHHIWHDFKKPSWKNKVHVHQAYRNVAVYMYPYIGNMALDKITALDIANALEPIWLTKHDTATKVKQWTAKVFDMAMSKKFQLVTANPASFDTEFMLPDFKAPDKHHSSVHYEQVPELWARVVSKKKSNLLTKSATLIQLLTAKRSGEVVNMRWQDVDLDKGEWSVFDPAQTKTGEPHRCPLPSKAVEILRTLHEVTGYSENVFHRNNKNGRIALDVPRKVLQVAWGDKNVTAHGTRHTLKTWAMEVGYRKELSEMQLSHEEQGIEAVYNDADYLRDRKVMMQHWQDFLTGETTLEERNRV